MTSDQGGDFDYASARAFPGVSLYHQGMDLVAVVSTGEDVWRLRVRGPVGNDTWTNVGIRWRRPDDGGGDGDWGIEVRSFKKKKWSCCIFVGFF